MDGAVIEILDEITLGGAGDQRFEGQVVKAATWNHQQFAPGDSRASTGFTSISYRC